MLGLPGFARAAGLQHFIAPYAVRVLWLIAIGVACAGGLVPFSAHADASGSAPINLGEPAGCRNYFYTVLAMNDGAAAGDLSVVATSVCGNDARPFRWQRGSWTQQPMPPVQSGIGGFADSVSYDDPEQPTLTLTIGDDFFWNAWASTAGQVPVALASLNESSHPVQALVSSEGRHIVGTVENNSDPFILRAVRWTRHASGWSAPEDIAPGTAEAVSADGGVVVGYDPYVSQRPWVWTASEDGGDLELLESATRVYDITHDGQVIAGSRQESCATSICEYFEVPVYWVRENGQWQMHNLQTPAWVEPDTTVWAQAAAKVGEAAIIVGNTNRSWEDGSLHSLAWVPAVSGDYDMPVLLEPLGGDADSPTVVMDVNRQGAAVGWSYVLPVDDQPEVTLWQVVDPPQFTINAGHAGAWYDPATSGQGLMIDVIPEDQFVFLAWFTFAEQGEPHWFTAQGNYAGGSANLTVYETLGGRFNVPWPSSTAPVGELSLSFADCGHGQVAYALDHWGKQGDFSIERLIPGSGDRCVAPAGNAARSVDINPGVDGAWHDPLISGQGVFLDVHSDPQQGGFVFLAWLTYGDDTASGQRWLTAQGSIDGATATLDAYETTGGLLDDTRPVQTRWLGPMTLEFSDCNNASLSYTLFGTGEDATPLTRLLPQGSGGCEAITGAR